MLGNYGYVPGLWLMLAAAVFLAAIAIGCWRHRNVPAAMSLFVASLFAALWLLGITLGMAAQDPSTRLAWHRFQGIWQLPAVTAATCFALEYVRPGRWLTRRNLGLLSLPPLLGLIFIIVDDSRLMWNRLEIASDGSVVVELGTPGLLLVSYGLGLILLNVAALLWLFSHSPQHRWPATLILFGATAGRGVYLLRFVEIPGLSAVDAIVGGMILGVAMYAIALFGFNILDPLPAAHTAALEQMREGMVVCDPRWRVVSLNPAAASILRTSPARARGQDLPDLLPVVVNLLEQPAIPLDGGPIEITLGSVPDTATYELDISLLVDFRGLLSGYLILLHEVTAQRQAQARLLAQRWAEAALQERVQLAQELHDGLSQNLAFLNLQAQAVQLYLQTEQPAAAVASLDRLATASREIQGEIRELIGNLLAVSLPSEGFCATLRQIVNQFEQQNGLAVSLDIDTTADDACDSRVLPPVVGVQLVRIAQEALANVRKHAGAPDHIGVRIWTEDSYLHLTISDSGAGFDQDRPDVEGKHYGLSVMRQRAERIGGEVAIHSAPGQGTQIEVRLQLTNMAGGDTV